MNLDIYSPKIAIYIRVSTERQAKSNLSLEDQLKTIKHWAMSKNAEIVQIYEDPGYSAYKGTRPGFERMIADVKSGELKVDYIVTYDLSRFTRKEITRIQSEQVLEQSGARLITIMDGIPEDEESAFIVKGMHGMFNEQFSRSLSKKSSIRLNQTASDGFHTGSRPPYGFVSVDVDYGDGGKKRKKLGICPEEAEVVRKIFELATTGKNGIRYGTKLIATELNETHLFKRTKKWTPSDVHKILTNTIYYGERIFGKRRIRPDLNPDPVVTKVPAIIDKEVFSIASELLKKNAPAKQNHQATSAPSLLTGIAKCHYCGCNFVINTGKSGKYKYYKCRNKIKHSICSCENKQIPKEILEKAIVSELQKNLFVEPIIEDILADLKSDVSEYLKGLSAELLGANRKKATLEHKHFNLIDKLASNELQTSDLVKKSLKNYEKEIHYFESTIKAIELKMSLPVKRFGKNQLRLFVKACQNVLSGGNQEATKALLLSTIDKVEISTEGVQVLGKRLKLLANISSYDTRHSELRVPSLISIWRRVRDSNPRKV